MGRSRAIGPRGGRLVLGVDGVRDGAKNIESVGFRLFITLAGSMGK